MAETEQLTFDGVLELEAWHQFVRATDERQYEYTTTFTVKTDEENPNLKQHVMVRPGYLPVMLYFDRSCSSEMYLDKETNIVHEYVDEEDVSVDRVPKVSEIDFFTKKLVDTVPVNSESGIADRLHEIINITNEKLVVPDEHEVGKTLVSFLNVNGRDVCANIRLHSMADRAMVFTYSLADFSGSDELQIIKNRNGDLRVATRYYGVEDDCYVEPEGRKITHAEIDEMKTAILNSELRIYSKSQGYDKSIKSLGSRILAKFKINS